MLIASDPDLEKIRLVQAEWETLRVTKDFLQVSIEVPY
jgi:hypothetical protein